MILLSDNVAVNVPSVTSPMVSASQSQDRLVGDVAALDQADALELGQGRQSHDRVVCEQCAAAQIDVPYAIALRHQPLHGFVGDIAAVSEVQVVQVLTEPRDGMDGDVGDVPALGEDQVPQPRGGTDDFLDGGVGEPRAGRQIKDSEVFVGLVRG